MQVTCLHWELRLSLLPPPRPSQVCPRRHYSPMRTSTCSARSPGPAPTTLCPCTSLRDAASAFAAAQQSLGGVRFTVSDRAGQKLRRAELGTWSSSNSGWPWKRWTTFSMSLCESRARKEGHPHHPQGHVCDSKTGEYDGSGQVALS